MKKNKILAVTATRAEFGLIRPIIHASAASKTIVIDLVAIGAHFSVAHGPTINEIIANDNSLSACFETTMDSDTGVGCAKTIALSILSLTDHLANTAYDAVLILGDRYELLGVASSALCLKLPIIHVAGGHLTTGAIDDSVRHSLTKLSRVHFTSTQQYRSRIIQLGEDPDLTFVVGSTGLDDIFDLKTMSKSELEKKIGLVLRSPSILCTYHPETLSQISPEDQVNKLLNVLKEFDDISIIFTGANTDEGGKIINKKIEEFVALNPGRCVLIPSLGRKMYLSSMQHVDAVVGNSSSGVIEVPSFQIGTLNIGDRQKGRIRAQSIIDCSINEEEIRNGLQKALSLDFKASIKDCINPFGTGNAGEKIVNILEGLNFENLSGNKVFFDI